MRSFYGFKKDQTQFFAKNGRRLVVTKILAEPLIVVGVKTKDKHGYRALQVGVGAKKKLTKPLSGVVKGLKCRPRFIREIKTKEAGGSKRGDLLKVSSVLTAGDLVKVQGVSKGKGFAGVMKRWGFSGGPRTHGQSDRPRSPGSIGQGTDPGRVWKGKKMAGQMGNKLHSVAGLEVVLIDEEKNELWLTGLVPSFKGGLIKITKTGEPSFSASRRITEGQENGKS